VAKAFDYQAEGSLRRGGGTFRWTGGNAVERLRWFQQAGLRLDWTDVHVGLVAGYIEPREAVLWAGEYRNQHPEEENALIHRLAATQVDESDTIRAIVAKLASSENGDGEHAKRKWRYLFLKRVLAQQVDPQQLLVDVERVYADFDYPEEMEPFIYYMPASEDISGLTPDQARQRLLALARQFLDQEGTALGVRPTA